MVAQNQQKATCPFCTMSQDQIKLQNDLALAVFDRYPVSIGHTLVLPKRHVADYWGLSELERQACHELLVQLREENTNTDTTITGFNIGVNVGESAGQTVFHCHFHFIPRRDGDIPNPRGGIRHVIPDKGYYQSK